MPKKVIYVITKPGWGGAQRYVYDLSCGIFEAGLTPTVISGGKGLLTDKLETRGIKTLSIPCLQKDINPFKELMSVLCLTKIFIKERPDIIHLNSTKAGILGGISSFLYKILTFNFKTLTVFTVHGWIFLEKRNRFVQAFFFVLSWISSFFYNKLILIDGADLKIAKKFISRTKLCLIPNGIECIDFLPREEARQRIIRSIGQSLDLSDNIWIGCVAELTKNKGVSYLIDAVSASFLKEKCCRLKTFIIGDGEDRQKLKDQIEALGGKKDIFLLGFFENAARYLTAFDLFILPSLKEGLPYVLIEAMQARVPVIATRVGGIPDLITEEKDGLLVDPQDSNELAGTIHRLIEYPEQRKMFLENARERTTKFGLHDMLNKTLQIYNRRD